MNTSLVFRLSLVAITLWIVTSASAFPMDSDDDPSPATGFWILTSDWGKGDKAPGKHILSIEPDMTGTIKDVNEDWTSELREVEAKGDAVSFRFFYGGKKEFDIKFEGNVANKEIKGKLSVFGATAAVRGTPLTAAAAKSIIALTSVIAFYKARAFTSSEGDTIPYRLFVPRDYDADRKYPVVLFHHGGGGAGSDNRKQLEGACVREWIQPAAQAKHPCFIVAPQIPGKKSQTNTNTESPIEVMRRRIRTVHEILDKLEEEFSIDKRREYVTGLSFGGECTWLSIMERPNRFAAAVPICAGNRLMDIPVAERGRKFASFPLWIFHGDADKVIPVDASREIVKSMRDAGGNPKYTEYPGVNHYCWDKAYRDPKLIEWLFSQSRASTSE